MYHLSNKFLVRPRPYPDEFILSFLQRVCNANSYTSIDQICMTVFGYRKKIINLVKGNFAMGILAKFTGLTVDEVQNLVLMEENKYYLSGNLFFCIECFLLDRYIKKQSYKKEYICRYHSLPMISRCLNCNKLYSWKIFSTLKCSKCGESIDKILDQKINTTCNIENVLIFSKIILKNKVYAPDSLSYRINTYIANYNKSHNILINNENSLHKLFKSFFFNENFYQREPRHFIDEYVYFALNIKKIISIMYMDKYLEELINLLSFYLLPDSQSDEVKILNSNFNDNFISNVESDFKKYLFFNYENCSNILGLDLKLVKYLCSKKILKCYLNKFIDIYSLFTLCIDIKLASTPNDLDDNYIYFVDLPENEKFRVIKNLRLNNFIMYNFNAIDGMSRVKLHTFDINY